MMSTNTATDKESGCSLEERLRRSADLSTLNELFSGAWEVIRSGHHYAGQPRNSVSTRSLELAKLALSAAIRCQQPGLVGEAHRMIAYALNADEQYAESIHHYAKAIT